MAHKTYQYCVAENWGKGFIEHSESRKIAFSGFPGNVWQVPAHNKDANLWVNKVLGTVKTKDEAQAIVDAEVQAAQAAWDALPDADKAPAVKTNIRPADITLED
jgi:hypothetical protein|tara:strand:- start:1008 stop:1319 length:312 start_codon:yes stop_codon:yes gene_type:complete